MTVRFALAIALLATGTIVASARKTTANINDRETSGFNGLDHVLQKPLGNPSFPQDERGFGRHLYFGLNAAGSFINNSLSGDIRPGYNVGMHFGGWFTPVYGLRFSGYGGRHSVHNAVADAWFGAFRADYMINLSSLLYGYKPNRTFELIGAYGVLMQYTRQQNKGGFNYGIASSLQMRFNTGPSFYLFLEPEVSVIAGKKYDNTVSYDRMYTNLGLNVGLGYRILTGKYREAGATKFMQSKEDNLFFGVGGGLFTFPSIDMDAINPAVNLFVGKMFSSMSGLQISGSFGKLRHGSADFNRYFSIAQADYVLNLNNAFSGYRPDARFQMLLNFGVSAGIVHHNNQLHPGVQAGVTGLLRLTKNWGLFVHPQIYAFREHFTDVLGLSKSSMVSVDLGVRYTVGDFTRIHGESTEEFAESKRWFANIGGGAGYRTRSGGVKMFDGFIGVGRQLTPISGVRLNLQGDFLNNIKGGTLGVDYLSSITTAMMGYNPDRVFDLKAVAGVFGGVAQYSGGSTRGTFGAKGGLQANFRINRDFEIYVAPQVEGAYAPSSPNGNYWTPDVRMQLGLQYNFGK